MPTRTHLLGAATSVAALFAAPSAASAALTLTTDQPCYSHVPTQGSDPIKATVTGGTPNAQFQVVATVPGKGSGSAGSATGTFDATGTGTAQIEDVSPPSGTSGPTKGQAVQLSVKDFGAGGVDTPAGQAIVTNISLSVGAKPSAPFAHRSVSVSGTPFAGKSLYGFVVRGTGSHVLRRISLGKGNACGFTTTKAIVAPKRFKVGTYRLYINAGPTLNKKLALYSSFRLYRRAF